MGMIKVKMKKSSVDETTKKPAEDRYAAWKKQHGEEGSKYITPSGEEKSDPWERDVERPDLTPEDLE